MLHPNKHLTNSSSGRAKGARSSAGVVRRQPTSEMATKTEAEVLFEEFCHSSNIVCEKVIEGSEPTPDYRVILNGQNVVVEVKQIDEDEDFKTESGVSTRIVGSHIRNKIHDVRIRKQLKAAANLGIPTILLVYNNLDPMQEFGTGSHDFIAAMYGELTVELNPDTNKITDSYHGRNRSLEAGKNTSFSAVGGLYRTATGPTVRIYENVFCEKNRLDFSSLPDCVEFTRIEIV